MLREDHSRKEIFRRPRWSMYDEGRELLGVGTITFSTLYFVSVVAAVD